ncbi:hypothetical protein Ae406Ps2_0911c [Pseudonocardia sp. Ae406_Ps2]|uniref:DUF4232 domain-containing protein n=1 Tax=Pseudonocardia sp. Ae406_Ps2 TaxID=1885033 RepID=UPI00095E7AE6|nr:DUF4232 domain-containing protein [Pseudonocardia sp. Ae406_Ps2]OLM00911.1 hypothetical protein Ae406Ps2_0911c [Pseudonocardia sp. Ae406_Ps2]OLM07296.1 hypothetical protein Ae331Ps2_5006 [Pseudonocardia sp. Ae331_Ps2]OLM22489.1 hypothetical protein Ae706Ps2_0921c [Pseudonocardia sp. Ae706_Ps2]
MDVGPREAGVGVALLLLLAGCGAAGPVLDPATSSPAAPAIPAPATPAPATPVPASTVADPADDGPAGPCTGDTLDVSATAPRTDGPAEVSYLVFRNTGDGACVLDGYPGVAFVAGNEGTRVGPRAAIDGPRARVRLAPGAAATAALRVRATASYPEADCVPEQARGLRVTPPGGSGGRFVPRPGPVCSADPAPPQATVGSVEAR